MLCLEEPVILYLLDFVKELKFLLGILNRQIKCLIFYEIKTPIPNLAYKLLPSKS